MNTPKKIIRIDASAGSGKTYQLSLRYMRLIREILSARPEGRASPLGKACHEPSIPDQPDGVSAILAITFTNKAAAEMKERILSNLKEITLAGESFEGFSISREEAERLLFHLIENYSDFNAMTIDAFMNTLLRAFAIEAGRLPNYELHFNPGEIYTLTLDRLMEDETRLKDPFLSFLNHLLTVERKGGFNPESMIRKTLSDLRKEGSLPENLTPDHDFNFDEKKEWKSLANMLAAFYKDLAKIQETLNCFNAKSVKPEKHLKDLEGKSLPGWITDGREMDSLLKKGRSCPQLSFLKEQLEKIREEIARYFIRLEIHKFFRVLEVYRLTRDEEARIYWDLNLFDGSRLPEKVQELLADDNAVPAAFCKLGERYFHYLVDEFQDTSWSQWQGMRPLVENSLSAGGSFFFVGDMKQAIYGWRGGDYALMGEAYNVMPPSWDPLRQTLPLKENRRSSRVLVDFFNRIFDAERFGKALTPYVEDEHAVEELQRVYKNSQQTPIKTDEIGYIHARFFPGNGEAPDPLTPVREAFLDALTEARQGYRDREILILARKNAEVETLAGWIFEYAPGVPFVTEQSLKLFTLPPVKAILNFLSYLATSNRDFYLQACVHDGLFGTLTPDQVNEIFSRFTGQSPFEEFFRSVLSTHYEKFVSPLGEAATRLSPYELTREVISRFAIPEKYPGSLPLLNRLLEQVLIQEQNGVNSLAEIVENFYGSTEETHLVLPEAPDAIRLMSIHKAKGLEADVVLIPFLNWPMKPQNTREIFEVGKGHYAMLSKTLCHYHPGAQARKDEIKRRTFIENFNLLYVALTRAREAIYLFVPAGKKRDSIGDIFRVLAQTHGLLPQGEDSFTIGTPRHHKEEERKETPPTRKRIRRARAEDIRTHLRLAQESPEETWVDARARLMGNLVHAALSTIHTLPGEESLEKVAKGALAIASRQMGISLGTRTKENLERRIVSTLMDLKEYFIRVEETWTEKELVSKRGEIIRIDRMVRRSDGLHVLEFKTGRKEEAHVDQVRRYLRILRSLDIAATLRGHLYYLETGELLHV